MSMDEQRCAECKLSKIAISRSWKDGVNLEFGFEIKRYRIKPELRTFEVFSSQKTDTMVMAKKCCDLNTTPDQNASPCRRCCHTETRIRNKK